MLHIFTPILLTNIFQINTGGTDEKYLKPILAAILVCCAPPAPPPPPPLPQTNQFLAGENARMVAIETYLNSVNLKQQRFLSFVCRFFYVNTVPVICP